MSTSFYSEDDHEFWENMEQESAEVAIEEPETEPVQEAPAEETTTEELPEETAETPERERDEKGRFVAKEEETPPEESSSETQELIGGKFKSYEALLEAYQHAERRLGERDNELGELRRLIEERLPEEEYEPPDQEAVHDFLDANPARIPQIAAAAYQEGDDGTYAAAMAAWREHDPVQAERFMLLIQRQETQKAIAEQQARASQVQASWEETAERFATDFPDFDKLTPQIKALAPEFPDIIRVLKTGTPDAQYQVLRFLYREAQDRETANLASQAGQVAQQVNAETAEQAEQAIREAQVASATAVQPEPQKKSVADQIGEQWEAIDKPHADGWQIN